MALYSNPPGSHVLERHELTCACGKDHDHVLLRPVDVKGQRPEDKAIFARGYCNACSPYLVAGSIDPPAPWWLRLLSAVTTRLAKPLKPDLSEVDASR